MDVERLADSFEQHDRQASPEMLLEFLESAQDAPGILRGLEMILERGRVYLDPQRDEEVDDAAPLGLSEEPGQVRVGRIERDADADSPP